MEPQETQISPIDILSLLEKEENKQEENKSTVIQVFNSEDDYAFDNIKSDDIFHLFQMDAPPHPQVIQLGAESQKQSPFVRFKKASISHLKFAFYYLSISTIVFVVLLTATNWSSYYTLISAYMNPDVLKNSGADILTTLDKSKITVYANEGVSIETKEKQEAKLKEKLKESNVIIREDRFSPKKLITNDAKINIDLDITPYDNRIIIPKIGKNIPLVDVGVNYSFDFDHMENIFMKELEKGIIRYPGTAKPWEKGNAFIFGHSSNYPWVKWEYNNVFALLNELSDGDSVIVYFNQKKYTYIIKEKKIVHPGDVKVLERDPEKKELSLMTCWPIGTTLNRLVVFGELQE